MEKGDFLYEHKQCSAATMARQRSLADFQTASFDQTDICESTFTSAEDKELKKGICHGLSVLWIKRYCDNPSESGAQRIKFLEENIKKAAKVQNYYHHAKGVAVSPAYKKKQELTTDQAESLEKVKGRLEATRVSRANSSIQPELDKQTRIIRGIEDKYDLEISNRMKAFEASTKEAVVNDRTALANAKLRRQELMSDVEGERETVGASQLNWALGIFKLIANQDSRKFALAKEDSAAVIKGIHDAVGDGPLLISLSHGSMVTMSNKNHAWSAYLDTAGIRIFDPIKGEFFADSQNSGALLEALKAAYDHTGQTLFTIKATRVAKL
jgi:hypothetical protein